MQCPYFQIYSYFLLSWTRHAKLEENVFMSKKHFCILPWIHMQVSPNGKMHSCCQTSFKNPLGDLHQTDITEIWNGDRYKTLRDSMLNGDIISDCESCFLQEDLGLTSLRQWANEEWASLITDDFLNGPLQKPLYLDLRFDNKCNFKCRSCTPHYSSNWYSDYEKIKGEKFKSEFQPGTDEKIWSEIEPLLESVQKIYFAGGEPLINRIHLRTLKRLLELNQNPSLVYNTNFSILSNEVLDLWKHFPNLMICASLDGVEKQGEFIRSGFNWSRFIQNKHLLQQSVPNAVFKADFTLSIYNVFHLPYVLKTLLTEGLIQSLDDFTLKPLFEPSYLNVKILSANERINLAKVYSLFLSEFEQIFPKEFSRAARILASALNYVKQGNFSNDRLTFGLFNRKLDILRQEKSKDLFPELHDLIL